jgi:uncharacterized membrane protein
VKSCLPVLTVAVVMLVIVWGNFAAVSGAFAQQISYLQLNRPPADTVLSWLSDVGVISDPSAAAIAAAQAGLVEVRKASIIATVAVVLVAGVAVISREEGC